MMGRPRGLGMIRVNSLSSLDPSSAGQGGRKTLQHWVPSSIFPRYGIGRQG